jgi:hypothetical protein
LSAPQPTSGVTFVCRNGGLDAVEEPAGADDVAADALCPVPKLTVGRDQRDRLSVHRGLRDHFGDRVVTATRSMRDTEAVFFTLHDTVPCGAFEDDDDRWLQPTSNDGVAKPGAQICRSLPAVPPPTVRTGAHDVRRVHHEHPLMMDVSLEEWAGAGSNRRPHAFQARARTN